MVDEQRFGFTAEGSLSLYVWKQLSDSSAHYPAGSENKLYCRPGEL